jgi:ABC-type uncharacterized transport system substrate-binding protein
LRRQPLIAAARCLIPFDCDDFSRRALYSVLDNVKEIKHDHNRSLTVEGIVINQFQPRAVLPQQLVNELIERRAPSICAFREVMEAGALMSYGVNLVDVFGDIAAFVDQVARGAKAGDLPMRAPSHFHTAFNLKTAHALGLDIAPTLLARADEVIE